MAVAMVKGKDVEVCCESIAGHICEMTGVHANHGYFKRGWHHWPNSNYVEPLNPLRDVAKLARELRRVEHYENP